MKTHSTPAHRLLLGGASLIAAALLMIGCTTAVAPYTLDATFTTCGATGATGPGQGACDTAYADTDLDGKVDVSAGVQSFTIETTGTYRVTSEGAQGASAEVDFDGGQGAQAQADLTLNEGDVLQIVVGQLGSGDDSSENGGGGGGSFVVSDTDEPLVVAGGGGGARNNADRNGCDANTGTFGIAGSGGSSVSDCTPKVDDEGLGGSLSSGSDYGAGGAGFFGDGEKDDIYGFGGSSWANGMVGGEADASCGDPAPGGFGGGGSGSGCNGGGGGGGYSGGDGGWIAGGGGSFVTADATNVSITVGGSIGEGDGVVTIEYLGN